MHGLSMKLFSERGTLLDPLYPAVDPPNKANEVQDIFIIIITK